MATKMRPIDDRVVVRISDPEEKTQGGIYLPDTAKEKPQEGTVTAVGPGKLLKNGERASMSVKKGDKVLFGRYSGSEVTVDDVDFKILHESDILGILEG